MGVYDYIIIGGGTAGSVLASRLSENRQISVLLLEAGGKTDDSRLQMPIGGTALPKTCFYRHHLTLSSETGAGRTLTRRGFALNGRGLGGSSFLPGTLCTRGLAGDYNRWQVSGFGDESLLPFFKKSETCAEGENDQRGGGGLMPVYNPCREMRMVTSLRSSLQRSFAIERAFLHAGRDAGFPRADADESGFGLGWLERYGDRSRRISTAQAFLPLARRRQNLKILTGARVEKIVFRDKKPQAVMFRRHGLRHRVQAQGEVILAAGAVYSPQLLMCSGVGPAETLKAHGIDPVCVLETVGQNLQDYPEITASPDLSIPGKIAPGFLRRFRRFWQWEWVRCGEACASPFHVGGVLPVSDSGAPVPTGKQAEAVRLRLLSPLAHTRRVFQKTVPLRMVMGPAAPSARGRITLTGRRMHRVPSVSFDLSHDLRAGGAMEKAVLCALYLARQPSFSRSFASEESELAFFRTASAENRRDWMFERIQMAGRFAGSCAMGNGQDSVVDGRCRIRHLRALRVADASIIPQLPAGDSLALTIAMAEKCAEMILEDHKTNKA